MPTFIGRRIELGRWMEILAAQEAHCVLAVGQEGMGKSALLGEMAAVARQHAEISCGAVQYTVAPTDTFESIVAQIIDDAFDAANYEEGSFAPTERRRKQWNALFSLIPTGIQLRDLFKSLRFDPSRNPRMQLLERLSLVSDAIPSNGRIVFLIDAEKYLHPVSADAWRLILKELPDKCKFVFAQRSDDVLANDSELCSLSNVVRLPANGLGVLSDKEVRALVENTLSPEHCLDDVVAALDRYNGHPYAVSAAIELIAEGKLDPNELPTDPTPNGLAKEQWKKVCQHGADAVRLFAALSALEVHVPHDVLLDVSGCLSETVASLTADKYLNSLLRRENGSYSVYHVILSEFIQRSGGIKLAEYHERAVEAYGSRLLTFESAPLRLPQHLRRLSGDEGFVRGVLDSVPALLNRGQTQTSIAMLDEAVALVARGTPEFRDLEATRGNVLSRLGQFQEAEDIFKEVLPFFSETDHGFPILLTDLAWIRLSRGEFKAAKEDVESALPLFQQQGVSEGIARCFNMLGEISENGGHYETAKQHFTQARDVADDPMNKGVALMHLANLMAERGEVDSAISLYKEAKSEFSTVGYREGVADAHGRLANMCSISGDFDRAIELHLEALEIEKQLGHHLRIATEYHALGDVYLKQDRLDVAEQHLNQALEIARGTGAHPLLAKIYSSLAMVHHRNRDFNRALFLCESSLSIFKEINDVRAVAVEQCNLAAIYITQGRLIEARSVYLQVLSSITAEDHPPTFAFATGNLGAIYRETGRFQEAREAHSRALEVYRDIGEPVNAAIQQHLLGMLSARMGDQQDAIRLLRESLAVFRRHGIRDRVCQVDMILRQLGEEP